ncbi:DUF5916 domain-containing protein [Kaistella antarctica]|uniref:Domain of uncharacterized function (DUF1083) n=1 Tax=Kaistella antarctica TaxID=266748 RepID=A0A3S4YQQ5_9FLAO|nr:DUF5916 domain-containing protein [Kaistella antarctica]KEY19636.1 hypothetical protein HY04_14705 [Kaistella antarctica]SEW09303.1 Carbohydrate family 9 binding domain-like [Kaistella antarctica]VEH96909.1 Domain of uncharacterised function (DUF1083) [Kaistella antarctica]
MKILITTLLLFFSFLKLYSQTAESDSISRKKIKITRISNAPKIDGILDEEIWKSAPISKNFVELQPENGKAEDPTFKTEVKILYDDTGIYFGAKMYDPEPDKIAKELVERDDVGNDDFLGVIINGYNDKQQSLEFIVMPSGVQFDAKMTNDYGEDSNWSAVWYSVAKIDADGWTVEMKIPYSELRFPKKDIQEWGINFVRNIQRQKRKLTWNFIDNKKGSFMLYDGVMTGIENINPPVRLSFLPYISTYVNNYDNKTSTLTNGGMDVKYGINDAFTLDTTLIPDFGQTAFDDNILNLGPFEQQFSEKRSFFTEGTELFSKGDLFYSRRVGDYPSREPNLEADEILLDNIQKVKLLNATKISGRTNKGLGIGFFNAITKKTDVEIKNEVTGDIRTETVEPLANYNVLVFDQRFNGNSSVSLINTNVTRDGDFRDANATALLVDLTDKKNKYNLYGGFRGSYVKDGKSDFGTNINAGVKKIFGKSTYRIGFEAISKDYNIDDLGYTGQTNKVNYNGNYSYQLLQPSKNFNSINWNFNLNYARRLDTDLFKSFQINTNISFEDKKFRNYGGGLMVTPNGENDLYEPRVFGKHLFIPSFVNPWIWFNSDNRKKFTYELTIDYYAYNQKGRNRVNNELELNYRLSDHFSVGYEVNYNVSNQEQGFTGKDVDNIYIGTRNRNTVINGLTSKYTVNNKMSLSFSLRHYYTEVNYKSFGTLQDNGEVFSINNYSKNNQTYNAWNVDLRYSWWFAPGSQLTLLYQNVTQNFLDYSKINFKSNFNNLFNEPMNNTLSLKLTYYIDYNQAKTWFKKKN